jgi:transcriptional regulator with XRE-family HTH domain
VQDSGPSHRSRERTSEQVIAANVRRVRQQRGITGAALAERLGMSPQAFSALENGKRGIRVDELMSVALALSVAPSHLMVPWDDDGHELAIDLRDGAERYVFGGRTDDPERVRAPHDFIVGRLSHVFALWLNPASFSQTVPETLADDELAFDRFERLRRAGWNVSLDGTRVSSPGGITRTEGGGA